MYSYVGKRIKILVKFVVTIQMILFILAGILIWRTMPEIGGAYIGVAIAVIGCFIAWINGLYMYAFGDIADNVEQINQKLGIGVVLKEYEEPDVTKVVVRRL